MSDETGGGFRDALLRYWRSEEDEERRAISDDLWRRHGREASVLVLDMSGFSLITAERGIVYYLAMIRRMQLTAGPVIESYLGEVVKFEADNCFAVFPDPWSAVQAALALNHAFEGANLVTDDFLDIRIACGIDHGDLLVVDGDLVGHPVNRASRLGEDVARAGQVLVTAEAMEGVPEEEGLAAEPLVVEASGLTFQAFAIAFDRAFER